jgi:hypothetical protein
MTFLNHIYGLLIGIGLLLVSFFYSSAYSQQLQCSIDITNVPTVMHPGQFLKLKSNVDSIDEISEYSWTVQGPAIKDYDDDVYQSQLLSAPFNLLEPTPLSSDHLKDSEVSFYWQLNPTNENRNVTLNVKNTNGETCTDTKTLKVIMSNTRDTQAEDFYVEKNHPIPGTTSTDVLQQHRQWHRDYSFWTSAYNNKGDLFFDFHRLYIAHFDKWRNTFGYPDIEPWNPGTSLPTGINNEHANRNPSYTPLALPSWFIMHPGTDGPARPLNGLPCETADSPGTDFPAIQDELIDFEPDQELLGCVLTEPYHNSRHVEIGGHMGDPANAPRDPVFWRYHSFIDDVSEKRFDPHSQGATVVEGITDIEENATDNTNPRIISQNPFRLYPYITELPKITEQEKNLFGKVGIEALSAQFTENVTGVKAEDFKINGSPATNVTGSGIGPYVFVGFESPQYGPINVTLSPGNIEDKSGNKFLGDSWNYFLVEDGKDLDNDGIENGIEANVLKTNITKADSDEDGITDGMEIVNTCLDPLVNDDSLKMQMMAHSMLNDTSMTGLEEEEEEPLDYDSDGLSNVEEATMIEDPCSRQSSFDSTAGLSERDTDKPSNTTSSPFVLVMQRSGGITGGSDLPYDLLLVDSISSKINLVKNGNITERQLSEDLNDNLKRIVNNSKLFESKHFYPPPEGSADYRDYSITVLLNGKSQSVSWTDLSKEVPTGVANLPYILDYIFGDTSKIKL